MTAQLIQDYWGVLILIVPILAGWYIKTNSYIKGERKAREKEMEELIIEISQALNDVRKDAIQSEADKYKLMKLLERVKALCPQCYSKIIDDE